MFYIMQIVFKFSFFLMAKVFADDNFTGMSEMPRSSHHDGHGLSNYEKFESIGTGNFLLSSTDFPVPAAELLALQALYNATNGPNWQDYVSEDDNYSPAYSGIHWNFTDIFNQNPCAEPLWYGINCTLNSTESLNHVSVLSLPGNNLVGYLPSSISNLTYLTYLNLQGNILESTIPPEIGMLTQLVELNLAYSHMVGPIPFTLAQLQHIQTLLLNDNALTGTIPGVEFSGMTTLQTLSLCDNHFIGTIPPELGSLHALRSLSLCGNLLNGTIPAALISLQYLQNLDLYNGYFTGTLPEGFNNLTNLLSLNLGYNYFTGTFTSEMYALSSLNELVLDGNLFSQSIPVEISQMSNLTFLSLAYNAFTGVIPSTIGGCAKLEYMYLNYNWFEGSLPSEIGQLRAILQIDFQSNLLSDQIPPEVGGFGSSIILFTLAYNLFTGTIPVTLNQLSHVASIEFGSNLLTGVISADTLSGMHRLQTLRLDSNLLTGSTEHAFNSTAQPFLMAISLSNNQLTGQISPELFNVSTLQVLDMTVNCLSGTLPQSICKAHSFTSLVLDGASSAPACRHNIFPSIHKISTYYLSQQISGTIPTCIYTMPSLTTLHLSGNAFTGSIPNDITLTAASRLVDLSLDHNQLTGTVPQYIQTRAWSLLDLSFNKLTGTLDSAFHTVCAACTMNLDVNRLSGDIPTSLVNAVFITLLNGNIFTCGLMNRGALPVNDEAAENYACGSNNFNLSIYLWIAATGAVCVLTACVLRRHSISIDTHVQQIIAYVQHMNSMTSSAEHKYLSEFSSTLHHMRKVAVLVTVISCVVLLPTYVVLSYFYGTYTHAYAWALSAGYLSGRSPGIVLFVFWLLLVLVLYYMLVRADDYTKRGSDVAFKEGETTIDKQDSASLSKPVAAVDTDNSSDNSVWLSRKHHVLQNSIVIVNIAIVSGVNVFYIWVTLNVNSQAVITFVEVLVALFKLTWNGLVIPQLFSMTLMNRSEMTTIEGDSTRNTHLQSQHHHHHSLLLRVCIVLFNNIVAPCAATAAISPNCFYYALTNPDEVSSTYTYFYCYLIGFTDGTCNRAQRVTVTTTYLPPFIYNYQCSSTLMSTYVSIFVYMYLLDMFAKPLFILCLRHIHHHWALNMYARYLIGAMLPMFYRIPGEQLVLSRDAKVFKKDAFVLNTISILSIACTFGVIFPPLIIVICVDVLVVTWLTQAAFGRLLLHDHDEDGNKNGGMSSMYSAILNDNTENVLTLLVKSSWPLIPLASLFYSMFLFDTLGDTEGWKYALWAPLCMCGVSLLVYALHSVWCSFYMVRRDDDKAVDAEKATISTRWSLTGIINTTTSSKGNQGGSSVGSGRMAENKLSMDNHL